MISLNSGGEGDAGLADLAPDLTPMLDILFILLVFFMLTAGAVFQSLDLTLPEDKTDSVPPLEAAQHIVVEIKKNEYLIDKKSLKDIAAFKSAFSKIRQDFPKREVVIAGDKEVSIERFLEILTYLKSQKIDAANILMLKGSSQ
ncbi:MAG: biopolymer transporter ExbD [Sneathiellales bacterium]|nr:biopolymer transporter ExbD [Sneathiellales bacterium]